MEGGQSKYGGRKQRYGAYGKKVFSFVKNTHLQQKSEVPYTHGLGGITLRAESFARPKIRKISRILLFDQNLREKNIRDFLKTFIFNGNNFREWLGKMNKKSFQFFFKRQK